jgi:integrase
MGLNPVSGLVLFGMTTKIEMSLGNGTKTSYELFLDGIQHTISKNQYVTVFNQFLTHCGIDADHLAGLATETIGEPAKLQQLKNLLNKVLCELMVQKQYKIGTMRYYQRVLIKFFETNGVKFKYSFKASTEVKNAYPELMKKNSAESMTKDEMRTVITRLGSSRNSACCLFSRDTGLRIGDCMEIQVKQIQPILGEKPPEFHVFEKPYYPLKNIHMAEIKDSDPLPATVIMGYESIRYLRIWMIERANLLRAFGIDPSDTEGFVFCVTQNSKKYGTKVGDKASINPISNAIARVRDSLGLKKSLKFHSFRNNHATDLIAGGVPELFVNVLQGRTGQSGSIRDYTNPDRTKLLDFYKRAYSTLALDTMESETVKSLSETVKQQTEENKALTLRIDWLEDFIQGLQEKEQNKPSDFPDFVRTLGFSRDGETQFLHPTKGVYKVVYDEKPKKEEQVDPLDAILANPDLRARLAEKIRKGEF